MKKARTYIKRLHVDLGGFRAAYEEMDWTIDVGNLEKFVEAGTVLR